MSFFWGSLGRFGKQSQVRTTLTCKGSTGAPSKSDTRSRRAELSETFRPKRSGSPWVLPEVSGA
eukprot:11280491-Alexandrium_andersonii.AAC.1